jgi:hypothetical protein
MRRKFVLRWPQRQLSMMLIGWSKDIIIRPHCKVCNFLILCYICSYVYYWFFFVRLIVEGETPSRSIEESSQRKSSSLITSGGRSEKSLYSPSFLLFNLGRTKKLAFSNTIKTSMCQRQKIPLTHHNSMVQNGVWQDCQSYLYLGLTLSWVRGWWVWQLVRLICVWAMHLADLKDIRSGNSPDSYILRLGTWLSPKLLVLAAYQTRIGLGSTFN